MAYVVSVLLLLAFFVFLYSRHRAAKERREARGTRPPGSGGPGDLEPPIERGDLR